MDTILTVLKALDINSTFFTQFAIVTVLYFVTRNLIWSKLQSVLDNREDKTTKMESGADAKVKLAQELEKDYLSKISETQNEAFTLIQNKKDEVMAREQKNVKKVSDDLDADFADKTKVYASELEDQKVIVMKDADDLSSMLVNKIVQ